MINIDLYHNPDPVEKIDDKWYFWDEVWANKYGPYDSEEQARKELKIYCEKWLR